MISTHIFEMALEAELTFHKNCDRTILSRFFSEYISVSAFSTAKANRPAYVTNLHLTDTDPNYLQFQIPHFSLQNQILGGRNLIIFPLQYYFPFLEHFQNEENKKQLV